MIRKLDFIKEMYQEYLQGVSTPELDIKYKTDSIYHFKKNNLERRNASQRLLLRSGRNKLNYDFKSITNPQESYIIGIFMADGWNNGSQIGLKLKDEKIVSEIRDYICKDIKLQFDGVSYSIVVSSQLVCENAINLGILKSKTTKELVLPIMEERLYSHFIRGYFDGDGTVFVCNKNSKNPYIKANICSPTIKILQSIKEVLNNQNIDCTIDTEKRIGKTLKVPQGYSVCKMDMHRLFIRKKQSLEIFSNFLYKDATFLLERKYDIFNNNKVLFINKKKIKTS